MNRQGHEVADSTGMKPYTKFIKHRLKPCISNHGQINPSTKFPLDPSDLVSNPSKIVAHGFNRGFDESVDLRRVSEGELDGG